MASVIQRTCDKIIDSMYKNGGHWVEITLKNGKKFYLKRHTTQSFEHLDKELYRIYRCDGDTKNEVEEGLTVAELAEFLIEENKLTNEKGG
jgi:hypothetical protein